MSSDAVVAMDTLLVQMFTAHVKMLMHSSLEVCLHHMMLM